MTFGELRYKTINFLSPNLCEELELVGLGVKGVVVLCFFLSLGILKVSAQNNGRIEDHVHIWAKDEFGNEEIHKTTDKAIFHGSKRFHHQ